MDRNPSPPPELENMQDKAFDNIGSTVFSQHWLFQILLKVIKSAELEESAQMESEPGQMKVNEMDKALEEEMCTLWDMSADNDVAHFLVDFKARDLFLEIIDKTTAPRLLEIVLGVLGNMAYFDDICEHFTEKDEFVSTILQLVGTTDTPTLVQVIRFIRVSVNNKKTCTVWIEKMKGNDLYVNNLKFILENSLNGDLLKSITHLVYDILDQNDSFCGTFGNESYISAFAIAANQLLYLKDLEALDGYWLVLHLLLRAEVCQCINTSEKLAKTLMNHSKCYLESFASGDDILPSKHRLSGLTAAITILNYLLTINQPKKESEITALKAMGLIDYLRSLKQTVMEMITQTQEMSSSTSDQLEMILETLNETFKLVSL